MKILVLIKDLLLSSQIKGACEASGHEYASGRSNQKFLDHLTNLKPEKVVIDLNIDGADPFSAIDEAKKLIAPEKIICFYSHVDVDLLDKAVSAGISEDQVFRRSQFFSDIAQALNN